MKKICFFLLLFSVQIFAQNETKKLNRLIKEKNIKRIIKTLAADEMMGRDAKKPIEIAKASAFIENEFEKIGLQKMAKLNNFKQEFNTITISPLTKEVKIDGAQIGNDEILIFSESESLTFSSSYSIQKIDKSIGFWENFQRFNRDSTSAIVLVDQYHEKSFKQAFNYYNGPRIITQKNSKNGHKIYILGHTEAQNITAQITQKIAPLPMNNVVGFLEGKSKKNEYIIFSGHYDHLGNIEAVAGDSIANGADDDASGTTAVIALAKYFKKMKNNERSLIFVAFTAEEIGGFGSQYFSKQLNPDQVMAMINIEMIGKPSKWGKNSAFMTGIEKSSLGEIMQKNLVGTPFAINKDPYPEQDLFYRSDNATLARLGVPAHSFSTDQIDSDQLYHSVDDEYESLDMSNITATIKALALATKTIISGTDTPTRVDKAGVRR
jgi:hypothetical protein